MNGLDLIRTIHEKYGPHAPPLIVYTGRELSRAGGNRAAPPSPTRS